MSDTMAKFGEVAWGGIANVPPKSYELAVRLAGTKNRERLDRLEFGVHTSGRVIGVRVREGAPPLTPEQEDTDDCAAKCDGCGEGCNADDMKLCRICDQDLCEGCRGDHEFDCDRWE